MKKVIVFGVGEDCKKLLLLDKMEVEYFVDNDKMKRGIDLNGRRIESPDILKCENKNNIFILVSTSKNYCEIAKQLSTMGFEENIHFFLWSELLYEREMELRKKKDFFSYVDISKDMLINPKEYGFNSFYGNSRAIKIYLGIDQRKSLEAVVEHGVYLTDLVAKVEGISEFSRIYTFSVYRKRLIEKILKDKEIIPVGPYIQYVNGYYDDENLHNIKRNYGKILLFFPAHATMQIIPEFNLKEIIDELERIRRMGNYDSVFVCIYWEDIVNGCAELYLKLGYTVVTAGHMYDYLFLDRLKNIIDLSDMTVSNSIGTHIGYCISRRKPHYCIHQKIRYNQKDKVTEYLKRNDEVIAENIKMDIQKNFSSLKNEISKNQIDIVEKYWGINNN